eukprot:TRINITY_DN1291_c0_g1_i4.p1 TRINITY_DN1291_c0_g1~~TRINITY_DN1291_c0_g1_i4.p1  ORF type:complete len:194 (+),score=67.44 TRINITY_DN1291_c0_g1_i4:119-700(+)
MLRSLVGSEMCIRDRYQRRVRGKRSTRNMSLLIRLPARSASALRPIHRAMSTKTTDDMKKAHEEEYFRKQEARMMAKARKYAVADKDGSKPEMGFLVRTSSFKVKDLAQAVTVDKVVLGELIPLAKTQNGFLGAERHVCGKMLDYKVITKWDNADNLNASGARSPYMDMALEKLHKVIGDVEVEQQNFMATER